MTQMPNYCCLARRDRGVPEASTSQSATLPIAEYAGERCEWCRGQAPSWGLG